MIFKTGIAIAACAFSALVLTGSASFAESMSVKADLQASSETPPNTSKGTGALTGTYDTSTKVLTWSVTYTGLTGPATAAHFHAPAPVGKSAGVEIPIKGELASPITGTATLTDEQAKNLTDGMTYFNIHTAANKGGEVRGQVAVSK
ncbi:CHRD domain-containing protein [Beijerinckia sp. L45]|uniref:CHRD domain-containing protein n=1 Tax=Beijerinckia sp. L45 TaxID=1641855 RepID=UPI00131BC700|nr:CHRD domain-containing protein [Beijerinckia sp. L45]